MSAIAYTVIATLPDEETARAYVAWLEDGHVDAVIEGGAESGMIVRIQEPASPIQVESRYVFATREAFEGYVEGAAPALREEGLARFGPERGVRFERRIGVVA
jgi:hypothetical protein